MNFNQINVGGAAALWAELEAAAKQNKAIVMFNWSPNFTDALYGGSFIEFPAFDEKCKTPAGVSTPMPPTTAAALPVAT